MAGKIYKIGSEALVQRNVVKYFRLKYPKHTILRIGNEGKRTIAGHKAAQGQGLVAGASDLFVAVGVNGFNGCWIELKSEDYKITPSSKPHCDRQISFLEKMKIDGYDGYMCFGFDEAKKTIDHYMTERNSSVIQLVN